MAPARVLGPFLLAAALACGALVAVGGTAAAADPVDQALLRLGQDADRPLTIRGEGEGPVQFVGVPAAAEVDNPGVQASTSPAAAGDAAIARYGAAFGTAQPGTTVERTAVQPTSTGDVVRYQQLVDGVPVLGGDLVVTLRLDGELSSVLGHTSAETRVPPAALSEGDGAAAARATFVKSAGPGGDITVEPQGRWLLDASLVSGSESAPARSVWRFEVTRGVDERRQILIDDRTGGVLMNVDQIQHAVDRVVCDNGNGLQPSDVACASNFARTETGAASTVADVNTAFDLSGVVSTFYQQAGGVDLTSLLGVPVGGVKRLASTVRWCYGGVACPYKNAFWNGKQMYYGQGYAGADDVVGHEITHGFTERSSGLFYWGQSGAMNESISDIIGEIIDHRNVKAGESATNWALGEDVPDFAPNGLRNMQDPTLFGDPDRTSSPKYKAPEACVSAVNCYSDSDGVHTNSGVGNKTFYLISQGGTFNGQTITGIDAGDPALTRSAKLWLLVDQSLSSGSDWADEGAVLDQSCQALLAGGSAGFTAADCDSVHKATLATELRLTPANNAQPADAAATCPSGTTKRVLFDSETGTPGTKFTTGTTWFRGQDIAHSGDSSWLSNEPASVGASSLTVRSGLSLPPGQHSYLFFQRWHVLDYVDSSYYDALTVEVDDLGNAAPPVDVAAEPWVNGPTDTISSQHSSPAAGRKGFGGDTRGYLASRLDLSTFSGRTVRPRFTMNTDNGVSYVGAALDDISVYTCDPPAVSAGKPQVTGTAVVGRTLKVKPGTWQPSGVTLGYQWLRNGTAIPKATKATYKLSKADQGKRISVRVAGSRSGYTTAMATSKATGRVKAT